MKLEAHSKMGGVEGKEIKKKKKKRNEILTLETGKVNASGLPRVQGAFLRFLARHLRNLTLPCNMLHSSKNVLF